MFVYLDYHEDLEHALSVILDTVKRVQGVADSPAASMRLHDLTPQHFQIESRFWTDSRRADFLNTASAVRVAIVKALAKEGIPLPNPDVRLVTLVETRGGDVERSAVGG